MAPSRRCLEFSCEFNICTVHCYLIKERLARGGPPHVVVISDAKELSTQAESGVQGSVGGGPMTVANIVSLKRTIKLLTVPCVPPSSCDVMILLMFCLTGCITERDVSGALPGRESSGVLQCNKT